MTAVPLVVGVAAILVAVAAIGAWISGYFRHDVLTLRLDATHSIWVETVRSSIQFVRFEGNTFPTVYSSGWESGPPIDPLPSNTHWGLGWASASLPDDEGKIIHITPVDVPPAAIAFPSAAVAFALLRHWWRKRFRAVRGLCPQCGYDLRASNGSCPECGFGREQTAI